MSKPGWYSGIVYRFWMLVVFISFGVLVNNLTISDVLIYKLETVNWTIVIISLLTLITAVRFVYKGYKLEKAVNEILVQTGFIEKLSCSNPSLSPAGGFWGITVDEVDYPLPLGVDKGYVVDNHLLDVDKGYCTHDTYLALYELADPDSFAFYAYRFDDGEKDFLVVWDKSRTGKLGGFQVFGR